MILPVGTETVLVVIELGVVPINFILHSSGVNSKKDMNINVLKQFQDF